MTQVRVHNFSISLDGFATGEDVRTGFIAGVTFDVKAVEFVVVDGRAIFEGDIDLGPVLEVMAQSERLRAAAVEADGAGSIGTLGVVINQQSKRWPNATMPYEIAGNLPAANRTRVVNAIQHYHDNTRLRLVERTAANRSQHPNFVCFVPHADQCSSRVGMQGSQQNINLASGCGFGATVHEIGHAWGLWHEQSREDRDRFVRINWQNIQSGKGHNFNQHVSDGDDVGGYDFGSLMHYGRTAFGITVNGVVQETITPLQAGVTIGQRSGLSAGDINALHWMYRLTYANQTVNRLFATVQHKNAWIHVGSLGWRKINPDAPGGVTAVLAKAAQARARNQRITVEADGRNVYQIYY
jgi:astacin